MFFCITTYRSFNLVLIIFRGNSPLNVQNSSNNLPLKEVNFSCDLQVLVDWLNENTVDAFSLNSFFHNGADIFV